jgi:hypothetical protein
MQLLRDNLTLWTSDDAEGGAEGGAEPWAEKRVISLLPQNQN